MSLAGRDRLSRAFHQGINTFMGPLKGFKIIEIAGIGPGQFAGMLLADMGASVVRIERPVKDEPIFADASFNLMNRSRPMRSMRVFVRVSWSVSVLGRKPVWHVTQNSSMEG
jgi:hypothetical protein